jgi:hypothetical protein
VSPWPHARRIVAAVLPLALAALPLPAQSFTCRASAGSNEATLLAHYAVPLAFTAALPQASLRAGEVALALETSWLPTPPADVRRSEECYLAKGENTALSPVLPRPRVAVGLPAGLVAEASLLPPVTVADATPFLVGLALAWTHPVGRGATLAARAHGTLGYVDGPVTCAADALQSNPSAPCFGDTPSNDRYAPNAFGAELLVSLPLASRWSALLGAGVVHARPRFDVNFTNGVGLRDGTRVRFDDTAAGLTAGLTRDIGARAALGLLAYAAPGRTTTVRLTGQWQLR